jgi:hypothetical protein
MARRLAQPRPLAKPGAPDPQKKGGPAPLSKNRAITWQQPTLAGPIVLLPLAARGLTAVFGMGTGGPPANGHQEV